MSVVFALSMLQICFPHLTLCLEVLGGDFLKTHMWSCNSNASPSSPHLQACQVVALGLCEHNISCNIQQKNVLLAAVLGIVILLCWQFCQHKREQFLVVMSLS